CPSISLLSVTETSSKDPTLARSASLNPPLLPPSTAHPNHSDTVLDSPSRGAQSLPPNSED
ncbi:hypothetical protein PanWU01x14_038570, partial [Parasponia andersonii]